MTTLVDDYSPIYVGDIGTPLSAAFTYKNGNAVDLTNITLSMKMVSEGGSVKTCSGTWTISDAVGGLAHYQWQTADVNTIGIWQVYITLTNSTGPFHADFKTLEVLPAP
jgi:hypothetical protein